MRPLVWVLFAAFLFAPLVSGIQDLPRPAAYVSDFANVLQPQERAYLERLAVELERNTTAELAIVTVSSLEGLTIEQFSIELAEKWKVGKKGLDNGIILLLAPNEREVRIEVGYGLEGALPDASASRIIRERMIPYLKDKRWFEGLRAGAENIADIIRAEAPQGTKPRGQKDVEDLKFFILVWVVICSLIFGIFYFVSGKAQPPLKQRKLLGRTYAGTAILALALAYLGSVFTVLFAILAFLHIFALAFSLPQRGGGKGRSGWFYMGGGGSSSGGGGFSGFGGGDFGGGGSSGRF